MELNPVSIPLNIIHRSPTCHSIRPFAWRHESRRLANGKVRHSGSPSVEALHIFVASKTLPCSHACLSSLYCLKSAFSSLCFLRGRFHIG
jgi:hypothetical protein